MAAEETEPSEVLATRFAGNLNIEQKWECVGRDIKVS